MMDTIMLSCNGLAGKYLINNYQKRLKMINSRTFLIFAVYDHGIAIFGPVDWKNVSAHCVENTQSPINIKTDKNTMHMFPYLDGFHFFVDNMVGSVSGILVNNGHAPTLIVDKSKSPAILTGGPWANKVYMLKQLHFHFGCDASKGSEHTVDGRVYSGEVRESNFENNSKR